MHVEQDLSGYIYVMSNPSFDAVKIGISQHYPTKRLKELSTTGVPENFVLEYCAISEKYELLEKKVHFLLEAMRPNRNREFFNVTVPEAVDAIRSCDATLKDEQVFFKTEVEIEEAAKARKLRDAKNRLKEEILEILDRVQSYFAQRRETLSDRINALPEMQRAKAIAKFSIGLVVLGFVFIAIVLSSEPLTSTSPNASSMPAFAILGYIAIWVFFGFAHHHERQTRNYLIKKISQSTDPVYEEITRLLTDRYRQLIHNPEWETELPFVEDEAKQIVDRFDGTIDWPK